MFPSRVRTNALSNLLSLCCVGRNTTLGHANAVLEPSLAYPLPSPTSHICRGQLAYRLEQRSGPVLVDRQTSPLLDSGALHWVLPWGVSISASIAEHLRQRLFGHGGGAVGGNVQQLGEHWPAAARGRGCT